MSVDSFDELLSLLKPHILYKTTRWRLAVPPEERLIVTLRYSEITLITDGHCGFADDGLIVVQLVTTMQGRRGTWYHNTNPQLQHQTSVADLVAHKRFSTLKFAFSAAGIMKVVVIVLFLIAGIIFLVNKVCPSTPSWYTWLYPLITLVIAVTTAIMYTFFMLGMAEDNPDPWVKMDLSALGLATVVSVAISIVTITSCDSTETQHVVPGPLGLVGAFMLAVSAAAMYITWKYREEEPAVPSALAVELAENSPA